MLINEAGKAVLGDIGLETIDWHPIASPMASVRWSSPEVNFGDSAVTQSDIWSWACVVLQVRTEKFEVACSLLLTTESICHD